MLMFDFWGLFSGKGKKIDPQPDPEPVPEPEIIVPLRNEIISVMLKYTHNSNIWVCKVCEAENVHGSVVCSVCETSK